MLLAPPCLAGRAARRRGSDQRRDPRGVEVESRGLRAGAVRDRRTQNNLVAVVDELGWLATAWMPAPSGSRVRLIQRLCVS